MAQETLQATRLTQAYSYIRFSSEKQALGDSLRRQTELTEKYVRDHDLALSDLTFRDLGISAFSGSNRTVGALSAFIQACKNGTVPRGSILLIESLDRLSREQVRKPLRLMLELIDDYGIEIHTLADHRVYGQGADLPELVMSIVILSRANEESERKSQRLSAAWRKKKLDALRQPGLAITSNAPAWVKAAKGQPFELIESRANTIREIFKLSIAGMGSQLIAQYLNKRPEKYPAFPNPDKGWSKAYIEKILRWPAAYGAYVPHRTAGNGKRIVDEEVTDGKAIENYFPAVVTYATFKKAGDARKARLCERRGRTLGAINNLFAGMVYDVSLNMLPMHYYSKGESLVTDSYHKSIKPNRISYPVFESAFLSFLDQIDWTEILDLSTTEDLREKEQEIDKYTSSIHRGEEEFRRITDLLLRMPSKMLEERALAIERQVYKDRTLLETAQQGLEDSKRKHRDFIDQRAIYMKLLKSKDIKTRARLREEVRRKVARIDIFFPQLTIKGVCSAVIEFSNGVERQVLIGKSWIYCIKASEFISRTPLKPQTKLEQIAAVNAILDLAQQAAKRTPGKSALELLEPWLEKLER